jgi:hypothetical protein
MCLYDSLRRARRSRVGQGLGGQALVTMPFPLRFPLAFDGKLLGQVVRIFTDTVASWYRRRHVDRGLPAGESGAVAVIQRANSDLRLNPHLHTAFLDDRPVAKGKLCAQNRGGNLHAATKVAVPSRKRGRAIHDCDGRSGQRMEDRPACRSRVGRCFRATLWSHAGYTPNT